MLMYDDKQTQKLANDLGKFADTALPFASGKTILQTAILARKFYLQDVEQKLITRNRFTRSSIRFNKLTAFSKQISKQQASAGSTADYMRDQEFGKTMRSKGVGVPVPTGTASGEGDRPIPKKKLPVMRNRRKSIRFGKNNNASLPKRQRNVAKIRAAAENKDKYVYLETTKSKGIYRIYGGKRKPRIKMLWDLSKKTRVIKAKPLLLPASLDAVQIQPQLYRKNIREQIQRQSLFK